MPIGNTVQSSIADSLTNLNILSIKLISLHLYLAEVKSKVCLFILFINDVCRLYHTLLFQNKHNVIYITQKRTPLYLHALLILMLRKG